jgi:hypothetical protein
MAKTQGPKENFRVVVEPRAMTDFGFLRTGRSFLYGDGAEAQRRWERDMQDRCDEIVSDIKRHADNVSSVYVEFDQEHVCEHCGGAWTESNPNYNGGCCEKDEEAEQARKQAAA